MSSWEVTDNVVGSGEGVVITENASEKIGFAPDALWITLGTLLALAAIALLVMQLVKIFRELREPRELSEQSVRKKLDSDHARLTNLEQSTARQEEELKLLLRSQIVMLHHSIDGNSVDNLKSMQRQIEEYLIFGVSDD